MSKILVVEPRRMLRQAIALILIPDHEVRFSAFIPPAEDGRIKECDVLVVDANALREQNSGSPQSVYDLQDSGVPTIWIEDRDGELTPKRNKILVVKGPIEKEAILSALAECLNLPKTSPNGDALAQPKTSESLSKTWPAKKKSVAAGTQLIELVDVVEDGLAQENAQKVLREKK